MAEPAVPQDWMLQGMHGDTYHWFLFTQNVPGLCPLSAVLINTSFSEIT